MSGLSCEAIVDAAISLADDEGLDAVSIRRVADRLGARPMSLYTYFRAKEELLGLMARQTLNGSATDHELSGAWRADLATVALGLRNRFDAHPWLHGVAAAPGDERLLAPALERLLEAMAPLRLTEPQASAVASAVRDYTCGSGGARRGAEEFEAGLALVLDGVAARYAR